MIVDSLKETKPTAFYGKPCDDDCYASRPVYYAAEADDYIETLESYVDELETENNALKDMINRIPDEYLNYKDSAYEGGKKLWSVLWKLLLIVATCLTIGVCVTGCASTGMHKTDDGMYYCISDGKYYNEISKAFCEVK